MFHLTIDCSALAFQRARPQADEIARLLHLAASQISATGGTDGIISSYGGAKIGEYELSPARYGDLSVVAL